MPLDFLETLAQISHDCRETRVNVSRLSYSRETLVRMSHDCRETLVRMSHDCRTGMIRVEPAHVPGCYLTLAKAICMVRRRPSTISNVFSSETAWPVRANFNVEPPRHAFFRIMSKEYPALLKRFTVRLIRLEKFGFPMIFLNFRPNLHEILDNKYLVA